MIDWSQRKTVNDILIENQQNSIRLGTSLISKAIQIELDSYNLSNGIYIANVHNAESYSRKDGYTHQPFCTQIWDWNVELWEFMRAWQQTLTEIPTKEDILNKMSEKPFIFVP